MPTTPLSDRAPAETSPLTVPQTPSTESRWDIPLDATEGLRDCFAAPPQWHTAAGLTFDQAAELLDSLENQRVTQRAVQMQDDGHLTVRWSR